MKYKYEEIRENIYSQSDWAEKVVDGVLLQLLENNNVQGLRKIKQVYLVGCGDSRIAGQALQQAFYHYSGVPAQAYPALTFSHYLIPFAITPSLLVSISYSGKVSRTVEATRLARQKGMLTFGISRLKSGSALAEVAEYMVALNTPATRQIIPGCLSYFASLLAVAVWTVFLGEARGVLSSAQAEELYSRLKATGRWIKELLSSQSEKIVKFAKTVAGKQVWHFLGSGPNWATAEYGAIKLLESAALPAIWFDIEEWAHTGYFLTEPATPVILIAPRGKSYNRLMELLPAIKYLKVNVLLITSDDVPQLDIDEERVIRVPHPELSESLTPLLFCVPLQLLALNLAERLQTIPFHLENQERLDLNSAQIYQSRQITSLADVTPD